MGRGANRLGDGYAVAAAAGLGLCVWLAVCVPAFGSVQPGEVFVADPDAGQGSTGAIVRVDPVNGAQTVVSSGGQFQNPVGVAIGPNGELLVADADALDGNGALFRVDPASGEQQVISSGGAFEEPTGIAANCCVIAVADPDSDPSEPGGGDGRVIYVDPQTGQQFPGQRPPEPLADPSGVALPGGGALLFTDASSGEGGSGAAYTLTIPTRGALIVVRIASEGNLVDPIGVTRVPSGFAAEQVAVADPNAAGGSGAVIGLSGGTQRVWSSGGSFSDPTGIAFRAGPPSELLVVDRSAGAGAVFRVDPVSGTQDLVSSAGSFAQPAGIAVAPPVCNGSFSDNPGSDAPDRISGGGVVAALGGDDEVSGDDPDDLICGDEGNDRIESSVGISLTYGDDVYLGGEGNDKLFGGFAPGGSDELLGEEGDDKVKGNGGRDRVSGGDGSDKLSGGNGKDRLGGGKGRDVLRGGKTQDVLKGGKGRDLCVGGGGNDRASSCERKRGI
jgi:DNA-binding beta-propeller fold protein YncE